MIEYTDNNPRYRPPAEASSFILQVDRGCPHNGCTFCGMYKGVRYERNPVDRIQGFIAAEARSAPATRRVFLADGDVICREFSDLKSILTALNDAFPRLARVNVYANGSSIAAKTDEQLQELRSLKLHTLYMGLESGCEDILEKCHKGETAAGMVDAGLKAKRNVLRLSVMVLLGLGGQNDTERHARETAEALNRMQPGLLSALRVIPVPGTVMHRAAVAGDFIPVTELQAVQELRNMVGALELSGTVFRANHSSNVVPVEGRLPRDKQRLLAGLDALIESNTLDGESPGSMPLWL